MLKRFFWSIAFCAFTAACVSPLSAEPKRGKTVTPSEDAEQVELFEAMKEGKIEVLLIPKDSSQATVHITNKGDKPLQIKLPATFAGVPVLAQFGGGGMGMGGGGMGMGGGGMGGMGGGGMGGMGGGGMGGGGMGGGGQGMGGGMGGGGMGGMGGGGMGGMGGGGMGGMGGGGMGGGGMGGMGGMFRVEPDKPGKFRVPCVCLEHGKREPTPHMKYTIIPLEKFNGDPRVATVCRLLGQGRLGQNTAQAATWHFANGLSWEELAHKNRSESKYTGNVSWFHPAELNAAMQLVSAIEYQEQQAQLLKSNGGEGSSGSRSSTVPTSYVRPASN